MRIYNDITKTSEIWIPDPDDRWLSWYRTKDYFHKKVKRVINNDGEFAVIEIPYPESHHLT